MKFVVSCVVLAALVAIATAPSVAGPNPATTIDAVRRPDVADLGRINPGQTVSISVSLRYRNDAQLDRLVDAVSDPASPIYRHYLSNQQFNAYFAPAVGDYNRVVVALERAGLRVSPTSNGTLVGATGSASAVERYFRTELHVVRQAGVRDVRYANVRPATIPAEIADVADGVMGLDDLRGPTTDHVVPVTGPSLPDALSGKTLGKNGGYSPFAIAQAYDYPVQHGFDGTGHAVAVAIDYDSSDADLTGFLAYFGETRTAHMFHIPIDGGQAYDPSGGSVESTLDTETIASLDPGADVYVYNFGAAFTWKEITDAYNQAVADDKVEVVSSSFGLCEDNVASSVVVMINKITKQGAAKGISFVASTGDHGRGGKCSNHTGQDVPAVTKYFTSVGGVDPTIDMTGKLTGQHEDFGSGGGPSDLFAIPKYQVGVPGMFSTTKRNLPDVSGPYQPDAFYFNGQWGQIGGTSWAAPATAAFLAEENQVEGAAIGFANPRLYGVFKHRGYHVYTDITTGNNGIACATGYDDCSGIGSLLAFKLAKAL